MATQTITCSKCKTENRKGASRCEKCGRSLAPKQSSQVAFPRCGTLQHPSVRHCAKCGANTAPNALALTSMMAGGKKTPDPHAHKDTETGDRNLVLKMVAALLCVAGVTWFVLGDRSASLPSAGNVSNASSAGSIEVAPDAIPPVPETPPAPTAIAEPAPADLGLPPIAVASPADNTPTPVTAPVTAAVQTPAPVVEAVPKPKRQRNAPKQAPAPVARDNKAPVAEAAPAKKTEAPARECSDLPWFHSLQCNVHGAARYFRCAPDGLNWDENIAGCKIH